MVGEWETVEMQLDSQVVILLKQKDFCGAIALTYFAEKLPRFTSTVFKEQYLLVILFRKINQFTCDKRFITFVQMG